jgi:signal peptidase
MSRSLGRGWWGWAPVAAVSISLLAPVTVFVVWSVLTGHRLEAVRSGSMQPTYSVGSMLVVKSVDPSAVRVGMPLSFVTADGDIIETHRVIQVLQDKNGLAFRTQGDANRTPDPDPVPASAVRGSVKWSVPHVGEIMLWLRWPRGFILLVVTPLAALLAFEIVERARRDSNPDPCTPSVTESVDLPGARSRH